MYRCFKRFQDIPIAHRQWTHLGHCAFIHGHNLAFQLEFIAAKLDENGFVMDFGKLKVISNWIDQHLDHAMLFAHLDPQKTALIQAAPKAWKVYTLKNTSMEGLAKHLFTIFDEQISNLTEQRVHLESIRVEEDSKNRVDYQRKHAVPRC